MAELAAFLRREARRQAARPELLGAVLAGRSWAYARHRLGFMSARMLLRSGSHALEIQLLLAAFVPFEYLAPLLTYRAICSLLGAAHWGALEPLRAQVRQAAARRELGAARRAIESWLAFTLVASLLGVGAVLAFEVGSAWFTRRVQLRDAYALACVLRLVLDANLRVLHSGVFALRRVHRPLWSSLAPDVLELSVIALGFGSLGIWSIPLATLAGGGCDAALTFVFVRRAYAQRRLPWPRPRRSAGALRALQLRAAGVHALGGVMLQLDGLLLLLLLHSGGGSWFGALYYVLRPLMAASTHWVRGFYFDLKLLEGGALAVFRASFLRFLERLGLCWAVGLAVLTLGFAHALWPEQPLWPLLWLLPFFVARSAFALAQLTAFGAGRMRQLLGVSSFALVGLVTCRLLGLRAEQLLAACGLLLALAATWSAREWRRAATRAVRPGVLDLGEWLAWLRVTSRVQLAVLRVDARRARAGAVLRGVRDAFPDAALARWGSRHVLLAVAEGTTGLSARALVAASAGALGRLWISPTLPAAEVFDRARRANALPEGWDAAEMRWRTAATLPDLIRRFSGEFASGTCCNLARGETLRVRAAHGARLRSLVNSLQARSRGRETRSERDLPFQLAVYAPGGHAQALFIAAPSAPEFATFRRSVRDASLRAAWPELFASAREPARADVPSALRKTRARGARLFR